MTVRPTSLLWNTTPAQREAIAHAHARRIGTTVAAVLPLINGTVFRYIDEHGFERALPRATAEYILTHLDAPTPRAWGISLRPDHRYRTRDDAAFATCAALKLPRRDWARTDEQPDATLHFRRARTGTVIARVYPIF